MKTLFLILVLYLSKKFWLSFVSVNYCRSEGATRGRGRFSPNTANHSKIYCCRWNKRLPKIIKSVALCEETSTVRKRELRCWTIHILKMSPSNCWLSMMTVFLLTNRVDWFHFLQMFVILSHWKTSLLTKYSQTSLLTTKTTNGWVSG